MSYDVTFEIDTGGVEPVEVTTRNYTSNVSRMWAHAFGPDDPTNLGLTIDANPSAEQLRPIVAAAVRRMTVNRPFYAEMSPENGWGDVDGAIEFLAWIVATCDKHPRCTVRARR